MNNDESYIINPLKANQIQYAVALAEKAGLKPNTKEEIDFFRSNETSEFVGVFSNDREDDIPIGVAGMLYDEDRNYFTLLVIDENYRRKGIGEKLVKWAIQKSASQIQDRPKVLQLIASKMGSPLYKRLGFSEIGYSNCLEIKSRVMKDLIDKSPKQNNSKQILSLKMKQLVTVEIGKLLWTQAEEMLLQASSSKARTSRLISLLKNSTFHLLYDASETGKPKLLAWSAIRPFSQKAYVIGPLIGDTVEDAIHLVQGIILKEAEVKEGDSFVVHTDSQSGKESQLAKALEAAGWEKTVTLEMLELSVQGKTSTPFKTCNGAKQFALTDFSHQ